MATRETISAILSQKFQFWRLFSSNFLTCRVASSRLSSHAIFGPGEATKLGKIASPARAKNRSVTAALGLSARANCKRGIHVFAPGGLNQ